MKRSLTSSEKILSVLCLTVLAVVGLGFVTRDFKARKAAAETKIAELEPQFLAAEAAAADAPFWEARQVWLDGVLPAATDAGKAHSEFLEELQASARSRGLVLGAPVMLKPEPGKHATDYSVTVQVSGPDSAIFRWLAELQSPEKPRLIKYLLLAPQSATPPRMSGTVTIAKLFKP